MRSTASLGAAAIPVEPARDWTAQDIDITAMSDDRNVAATRDDVDKLYASINYLRVIDGEKHIVFLSEEGLMNLGRSEDADSIAAVATDARVTLSAVHTTGIATSGKSVRTAVSVFGVHRGRNGSPFSTHDRWRDLPAAYPLLIATPLLASRR